jgi:hypothetical protein
MTLRKPVKQTREDPMASRSYQSPLGTTMPLEFILETFKPICSGCPETHDEKLFVSAWNRATGRIVYLESEILLMRAENERLRRNHRRGFFG